MVKKKYKLHIKCAQQHLINLTNTFCIIIIQQCAINNIIIFIL